MKYAVNADTNEEVAIKVIEKETLRDPKAAEQLAKEVCVLARNCPSRPRARAPEMSRLIDRGGR